MKKNAIVAITVAVSAIALSGWGFAQENKDVKSVSGEVVDLNCYMASGAHGADHKACGVHCAQAGNPIGILDAKGHVYLLLASDRHDTKATNDKLIDKMAEQATVSGKLVKRGGMDAVIVDSVK